MTMNWMKAAVKIATSTSTSTIVVPGRIPSPYPAR
ncbi:MAG: hypothetical protein QOI56_923 [Actinomycetota bacterium]|nr:hypothetical protein [Actinomycetota bacterium]